MDGLLVVAMFAVLLFVAAIYRSGYKNGYLDGFQSGKEDSDKEYQRTIDELERFTRKDVYYQ